MTNSGDAAEQVIRRSLEGIDYAIRITGSAAKNIAAFLVAAFKSDGTDGKIKLKGKERLVNMLKSGKDTKIFAIKNSDLKQFATEAKRYGVTYCVLKDKKGAPESAVEIMAIETDASKISRIMDRLEFAAVDLATVEAAPAEREALDRDDTDKLVDMLIDEDGKAKTDEPVMDAAREAGQNPTIAGAEKSPPSEPRSKTLSESAEGTPATKKPESVREFLRERTAAAKKKEDKQPDRAEPEAKPKTPQRVTQHQPPQPTKKKSNNKERG
jgi:hypothetical protein